MALTNYNMLICKGEVTRTETVERVEYDVTQGEVLDALKACAMVILITHEHVRDETEGYYIYTVSSFITEGEEATAYVGVNMEFSLNDPDEPLQIERNIS